MATRLTVEVTLISHLLIFYGAKNYKSNIRALSELHTYQIDMAGISDQRPRDPKSK